MAAPHVAGLAARLFESNPSAYNTPAALEQGVRQLMATSGGSNLPIARFGGVVNAVATIDMQALYDNPVSNYPPRMWRSAQGGVPNFSGYLTLNPFRLLRLRAAAQNASSCSYGVVSKTGVTHVSNQNLGNLVAQKEFQANEIGFAVSGTQGDYWDPFNVEIQCTSPFGHVTTAIAKGRVTQ